jgi:metal-responsive CopG/Arc/MetJ family transcriptional regulator
MRTTITLDKDVAARLDRLRAERPFKELVNDALRLGLDALENSDGDTQPYAMSPVVGKPRRTDLDNVAEVLAQTDGDGFR